MTATIAPADINILRAIAAGDRVHHMRRRRLTNMGLVTSAGDLTKLGAEAISRTDDAKQAEQLRAEYAASHPNHGSQNDRDAAIAARCAETKKPAKPCVCSPDCDRTSKGKFAPGHDARWAGVTGRRIATYAALEDVWNEAESAGGEVGASRALMLKVVRIAENAIAKRKAA